MMNPVLISVVTAHTRLLFIMGDVKAVALRTMSACYLQGQVSTYCKEIDCFCVRFSIPRWHWSNGGKGCLLSRTTGGAEGQAE